MEYKFLVDGEWSYDKKQPTVVDDNGHISNVVDLTAFKTHWEELVDEEARRNAVANTEWTCNVPGWCVACFTERCPHHA